MEKKKNISPSIEEAKQRIKLYNDLSKAMRDLSRKEKRTVVCELRKYVKVMHSNTSMEHRLFLTFTECALTIFEYLYQAKQFKAVNSGFDSDIRKHIEDVFMTILRDHDAD